MMKLKELYSVSKDQTTFCAYEKSEAFQQPESMNIIDYINEFEQLNQKLINYKIDLASAVRTYQLLKNANLPKEKRDLARATISDLTYESMKKLIVQQVKSKFMIPQILKLKMYSMDKDTKEGSIIVTDQLTVVGADKIEVALFNRGPPKNLIAREIQLVEMEDRPNVIYISPFFTGQYKPVDKSARNKETAHVQLSAEGVEQCFLEQVVSESLNSALLDTGCSANACGINWLQCYVDSHCLLTLIFRKHTVVRFSNLEVNNPVSIAGMDACIRTDVVDCEIPLFLPKGS